MTGLSQDRWESSLGAILPRALRARAGWTSEPHDGACRLFNGFLEGDPDIVIDLYARTLVLYNYARDPQSAQVRLQAAQDWLLEQFPWVQTVVVKTRGAPEPERRCGVLAYGSAPDRKIREHGVWYAVDLMLNLDSSLYLDTRELRAWASSHLVGKKVLNTFAYTGSLGVAALAGGASQVVQMDLNRRFLNLAKESYQLNGFAVKSSDFLSGDFWVLVSRLKREDRLFDCVFVDPPFFSVTDAGKVDLVAESHRVINKARPLVGHEGYLVTINNALFVSGDQYMKMLTELCSSGYLSIDEVIPVPPDSTGFAETRTGALPADPAPFNHSTKIVVLRVRRKDERRA